MAYYFYIADLKLPITPESLTIKTPSKNTNITLINDGEINILKKPGLREISFEFLLPHQKYPFANHHTVGHYANTVIPLIQALKEDGRAFLFKVIRMNPRGEATFHTCILSHIEDFEFEEDAESLGFDVKCKMTLKEWKPYSTKAVKVSMWENAKNKIAKFFGVSDRSAKQPEFKKVTVLGNESVFSLVKKHYGDTNNGEMDMVLKANSMAHPMDYKIGKELILPAKITTALNKNSVIHSLSNLTDKNLVETVSSTITTAATKKLDNLVNSLNLNILQDTVSPDKLLKKLDNLVGYTVSRVGDAVTGKVIQKLDRLESYVVTTVYKKVNSLLEKIDGNNKHDVDSTVREILEKLNSKKAQPITETDIDDAVREVLDKLNANKSRS